VNKRIYLYIYYTNEKVKSYTVKNQTVSANDLHMQFLMRLTAYTYTYRLFIPYT